MTLNEIDPSKITASHKGMTRQDGASPKVCYMHTYELVPVTDRSASDGHGMSAGGATTLSQSCERRSRAGGIGCYFTGPHGQEMSYSPEEGRTAAVAIYPEYDWVVSGNKVVSR